MKDLNQRQRDELTQQYVEIVVDNMSEKDLVRYAREQLIQHTAQLVHLFVRMLGLSLLRTPSELWLLKYNISYSFSV